MRLAIIFALLCTLPFAHALVQIDGFVTDAADIFTPDEEAQLSAAAQALFDAGRLEYAIVTVPDLEGFAIEDYSLRIVNEKLGDTKLDNGLLLLIAPNERQYRFEVGYGLEGTLNDAKIGRVGRAYLVPAFKEGKYAQGTLAATAAIEQLTQGIEPNYPDSTLASIPLWFKLLLAWIIVMVLLNVFSAIARKKNKQQYADAADGLAIILGGGGFGGRGGGGFSGGGGFGGGGFGGGGASGGW